MIGSPEVKSTTRKNRGNLAADAGEVDEQVALSGVTGDEAESLSGVEPFHGSLGAVSLGGGVRCLVSEESDHADRGLGEDSAESREAGS